MSITTPAGFVASGHAAGIKASGALDLALLATDDGLPVPTAATFTTNLAAAAPVQISRSHLEASQGARRGRGGQQWQRQRRHRCPRVETTPDGCAIWWGRVWVWPTSRCWCAPPA